jgi:hypothetical protein
MMELRLCLNCKAEIGAFEHTVCFARAHFPIRSFLFPFASSCHSLETIVLLHNEQNDHSYDDEP